MAKGGAYEREISKQLSLWWTDLERDDCFWRSSNSGGRATVRGRKGEQTAGHYGDICATNDIGKPLMDVVTIEVKRGYSKHSIADLLDGLPNRKPCMFEQWINQAEAAMMLSRTPYWMLIHRRDSRAAMVYIPVELYDYWIGDDKILEVVRPVVKLAFLIKAKKDRYREIFGMRLKDFFLMVRPSKIRFLIKRSQSDEH